MKPIKKHFEEFPIFIPQPKTISFLDENMGSMINSECYISPVNIDQEYCKFLLEEINDFLKANSSFQVKFAPLSAEDKKNLEKQENDFQFQEEEEEAYVLVIQEDLIMIQSTHEKGLFYGVQTLIQIIKNSHLNEIENGRKLNKLNVLTLPNLQIVDYPDLKMRGITDDIARGQVFTIEAAKRYIKLLSHYKINFYFLYLEDMVAHPKHPDIGKKRGALTPEELKELDAFAKKRFIEIVPIFQCLGHVDNILIHEKYEHLGEFPGAKCYDISNPELYDFLNDYIAELSKCLSSKYFHVGCDETFDIGKYRSKQLFESQGEMALLSHYEKVYQLAIKNGNKHAIMYEDFIRNDKEIIDKMNKDIILMYWDYAPKEKYLKIREYVEKGFKVIASPSILNWQRIFPNYKNASINIMNMARDAKEYKDKGCLGLLTSNWGDYRYYTLRGVEYLGGILTGDATWSVNEFNLEKFLIKYGYLYHGIKKPSLNDFKELILNLDDLNLFFRAEPELIFISFYMYFFKHPFPLETFTPPIKNHNGLKKSASKCLELHAKLKSQVQFEHYIFQILEFCARMALTYSEKISLSLELSNNLEKLKHDEILKNQIISKLHDMKEKINSLKNDYEKFWLREAKRPCLDHNLDLFDFLITTYEKKIKQLSENIWYEDPSLPSEWIWVNEKISPIAPRYFRKTFHLKGPVKKALIQCLACTQIKLYINGTYIGSAFGRTTFAILPILYRTRVFDITNYLKEGENIIAIEAYNFEYYKGAINIYGQILLHDDTLHELISDTSWIGYKDDVFTTLDWTHLDFNDESWITVYSHGCPPKLNGDIFKPNLLEGEQSLTHDYYGIESHVYDTLRQMLGKRGEKRIEKMIQRAYEIMNPFG
ncbi:MAG: family 20 glycosylhydrolase [Promethearchaeota archaeon]